MPEVMPNRMRWGAVRCARVRRAKENRPGNVEDSEVEARREVPPPEATT